METTVRVRDLEELRRRRADLRDALCSVEDALAAPAGDRSMAWGERVRATVCRLAADFAEHVDLTEGPGGLHAMILEGDVRLTNAVSALTADHGAVLAEIAALLDATQPPVVPNQVEEVREAGLRLLGHMMRHRQRGADLVYEAYDTDLGGVD